MEDNLTRYSAIVFTVVGAGVLFIHEKYSSLGFLLAVGWIVLMVFMYYATKEPTGY